MSTQQIRTREQLRAMPKPGCSAELEVLSQWYFGVPLHFSKLYVHGGWAPAADAGATYEVAEPYNSYHGDGFLFGKNCIKGYDYSGAFWQYVVGNMSCGGIASHSYGQVNVFGHRDVARLRAFESFLRQKKPGRLRKAFERLAREQGAGENTVTRDSRVQIAGRVDGAAAVSFAKEAA